MTDIYYWTEDVKDWLEDMLYWLADGKDDSMYIDCIQYNGQCGSAEGNYLEFERF